MLRTMAPLAVLLLLVGVTCAACAKNPLREIIDPAEAAKDLDFGVQGEYEGRRGEREKVGAQVIALGDGKFGVKVTKGGLPGDGWERGQSAFHAVGQREQGAVVLSGDSTGKTGLAGKIIDGTMSLHSVGAFKVKDELKRVVRHSPTEGVKPPKGAIVLFDGTTADKFADGQLTPDKNLMCGATTKQKFNDYTLHLEFRLSYMPEARGQARSNSGVYLHDCYEVQVLDSFGLEGENNECGGFYQIRKPDVNMCYPPLQWQNYDVDFTAPRYAEGKKVSNARVTMRQNGVVIHPDIELPHATPGRQAEGPGPRPIYLQGHGNKVEYRNVWVKEKLQKGARS
ncbi:MAG: DUF1080 domain-containing protein [Planctomycetaceae bacterium]|nr:DUF1080 domain-containing protein [Planctomycetaceae bacterium]